LAAGFNGGEEEIRTPEELTPLTVFETAAFDRSATSPVRRQISGIGTRKKEIL
jgi:hypothetical protein